MRMRYCNAVSNRFGTTAATMAGIDINVIPGNTHTNNHLLVFFIFKVQNNANILLEKKHAQNRLTGLALLGKLNKLG